MTTRIIFYLIVAIIINVALFLMFFRNSNKINIKEKPLLTLVTERDNDESLLDVVVLHGLSNESPQVWTDDSGNNWVEWLQQDLPDIRVWTTNYPAPKFGQAQTPREHALNTLSAFKNKGIGSQNRGVCLIGYSLGGIISKEIVRRSKDNSNFQTIYDSIKGVVLIATPNDGAPVANILNAVSPQLTSKLVDALEFDNDYLIDLSNWYSENGSIFPHMVFFETRKVANNLIVPRVSADPRIVPLPESIGIDRNHLEIQRVSSKEDILYASISRFIRESCLISGNEITAENFKLHGDLLSEPSRSERIVDHLLLRLEELEKEQQSSKELIENQKQLLKDREQIVKDLSDTVIRLEQSDDSIRKGAYSALETGDIEEAVRLLESYTTQQLNIRENSSVVLAQDFTDLARLQKLINPKSALESLIEANNLDSTNIEVLSELASLQNRMGYIDESIKNYEAILKLSDDALIQAVTWLNLGSIYSGLSDYGKAMGFFDKSLNTSIKYDNKLLEGKIRIGMSSVHIRLSDYKAALVFAQESLKLAEEIEEEFLVASSNRQLGIIYVLLSDYSSAKVYMDRALDFYKHNQDVLEIAVTLLHMGIVFDRNIDYEKAIEHYQQALDIFVTIEHKAGEATTLGNLAAIYSAKGNTEMALTTLDSALLISQEIGDIHGEISKLANKADTFSRIENYQEATTIYNQAISLARNVGDKRQQHHLLMGLGIVNRRQKNYTQAIKHYEEALLLAREIGNLSGEGAILGNLGTTYREIGQVKTGIDKSKEALEIAERIGDKRGELIRSDNLGRAYAMIGDHENALRYNKQALSVQNSLAVSFTNNNYPFHIGVSHLSLEEYKESIPFLLEGLEFAQKQNNNQRIGAAQGNLGAAYHALDESDVAIKYLNQALETSMENQNFDKVVKHYANLGFVYQRIGDNDKAIEYFTEIEKLSIQKDVYIPEGLTKMIQESKR